MALCHNSALVFKLDSRTITCNLISEFDSYPTIFSNWHFIDIFIYSFWLSGSEEMQCSAISPIPSNFSSWNRTIGLQILYATVIHLFLELLGTNEKPQEPRSLLMRQNINFRPRVSLSCVLLKSQCFNLLSLNISAGPHPRTSYLVNSSLTLLEWYSR